MQPVDDQHRDQRAHGADQRPGQREDKRKSCNDRDLRQQVIEQVRTERLPARFGEPPRQRRQLVITKLPFAAIDQRFDQIERQVAEEQRRQRGPEHGVQKQDNKGKPEPGCCSIASVSFDIGGRFSGQFHRAYRIKPDDMRPQVYPEISSGKLLASRPCLMDKCSRRGEIVPEGREPVDVAAWSHFRRLCMVLIAASAGAVLYLLVGLRAQDR